MKISKQYVVLKYGDDWEKHWDRIVYGLPEGFILCDGRSISPTSGLGKMLAELDFPYGKDDNGAPRIANLTPPGISAKLVSNLYGRIIHIVNLDTGHMHMFNVRES